MRRRAEGLRPPAQHPDAEAFSARVHDVHEWLAPRLDALPRPAEPSSRRVAVQDPCHLRHVQRAHLSVRTVLQPYVQIVELDDEGLCCGAGGAYSALHPEMSGAIRERKVAAIDRAACRRRREREPRLRAAPRRSGCRRPSSRWRSSTRRSMAGEFDDIRAGSRRSPRSSPTWPSSASGSPSMRAAPSFPSTSGG